MNISRLSAILVLAGAALVSLGFALMYPPAGVVACGVSLAVIGVEARRQS